MLNKHEYIPTIIQEYSLSTSIKVTIEKGFFLNVCFIAN